MSARYTIDVEVPENLRRELDTLAAPGRLLTEAAAAGVEAHLREHFRRLQARPRKDGLKSTGFWSSTDGNSVAEQIAAAEMISDTHARIGIDSPELAHKLTGGTIRAADYGHTYLTIPATDRAAQSPTGARGLPSHIEWVEHPDGGVRPALVAGAGRPQGGASPAGAESVLFWLVRSTTHRPMPGALPAEADLAAAARESALDAIDALLARGDAA